MSVANSQGLPSGVVFLLRVLFFKESRPGLSEAHLVCSALEILVFGLDGVIFPAAYGTNLVFFPELMLFADRTASFSKKQPHNITPIQYA